MARKRLPRAVFDYVDGGADEEITLGENRSRVPKVVLYPPRLAIC